MARKIFVSYKHRDVGVEKINLLVSGTARDYVNYLERLFQGDHIYKGERGDEDLGAFRDEAIQSHLRERIFDSSVTLILISKNMKDPTKGEQDQWIPWEVSYSLRSKWREDRTSSANAMLAVVLPDENGSYAHFVEQSACTQCATITWRTDKLFSILGKNMFNRKKPNQARCVSTLCSTVYHTGNDHSYIHPVRWDHFIANVNYYIELAIRIRDRIDEYEVVKVI